MSAGMDRKMELDNGIGNRIMVRGRRHLKLTNAF